MTQDLPLSNSAAPTLDPPHSDIRELGRASSSLPPKPDLPTKWREKRRQVWSTAQLRSVPTLPGSEAEVAVNRQSHAAGATTADLSASQERSDGVTWVELRDDEILSLDAVAASESTRPAHLPSMGVARALLVRGAELSRGTNALLLPLGLFVAGAGLMIASGVQLFVVLPGLFLRHGLVRFANWTIRQSSVFNRRVRSRLAHS
jgi:hypothetical protein